jgi:hypothetical protein
LPEIECGFIADRKEKSMHSGKRILLGAAGIIVAIALAGTAVAAHATAPRAHPLTQPPRPAPGASHLSLSRFDLNGYVLDTSYTLGRNTGNTFQQTYGHSMVQGVPIKGPLVGTQFPAEDYVAIPIGHHELYVTWLDPATFAIVDAFVMDFAHHVVFDYAPGSDHPESAGTVTVVHRGHSPLP